MTDHLIQRADGDDVVISVKVRRANLRALLTDDGVEVLGRLRLEPQVDEGVYAIVAWTPEMPSWPEPVPGNDAARRESALRRITDGALASRLGEYFG